MKKFIILAIISLFCSSIFSQISDPEIWDNLNKQYNAARLAAKDKDYKKATTLLDSSINYYNNLPANKKEEFSPLMGTYFYDNACYYSLSKNKQKALYNLEKAIEYNWNDYAHTLKDTDLDNLRGEKQFKELMLKLKKTGDFLQTLKDSPSYNNELPKEEIQFTYLSAADSNLVHIRKYFNLDSIAGNKDEISQIKNLMTWVHNRVQHNGSSTNPTIKNAIDIVKVCDTENRGVNCRMMATILNECYLAMGFKSHFITCMPKEYISDCHVINSVYSKTLNKWLWIDPTFNAYVSDENGNLLSIAEVRENLRTNKPLVLNEDANWNNETKQTTEYYLYTYMAKNLYWFMSSLHSGYNIETDKTSNGYLNLYPVGYEPKPVRNDYITNNDKIFWVE